MATLSVFNLNFSSSFDFSDFQKTGLDAYSAVFPKDSSFVDASVILTFIKISAQMTEETGMPPEALKMYVKTTFFGLALPPEKIIKKQIFDNQTDIEVLNKDITGTILLLFSFPVNNDLIFTGIEYNPQKISDSEISDFINELSQSLKLQ